MQKLCCRIRTRCLARKPKPARRAASTLSAVRSMAPVERRGCKEKGTSEAVSALGGKPSPGGTVRG